MYVFSIMNSLVIVLFLSGMVAMIMLRTLHKDIARYNQIDNSVSPLIFKMVTTQYCIVSTLCHDIKNGWNVRWGIIRLDKNAFHLTSLICELEQGVKVRTRG